ncbi:MAG: sugar transferase [Chitinophagaceae bacterium]
MTKQAGKIAVITKSAIIIDQVKTGLKGLFDIDVYKNGFELHHVMEKSIAYKAIISDDNLEGSNGLALHKILIDFGYDKIPFILLLDHLDNEQRVIAMKDNIAEIFEKPIDPEAIRLRVPYLAENYVSSNINITPTKSYRLPIIKRLFDITFSGLALIFLSPVFIIVAILIKAESKGPVFYYSLRVGSGYDVFKFFKFRSMYSGADTKLKSMSHLNQYNNKKININSPASDVKELCEFCEREGISCVNPLYADNKVICEILYNKRKKKNLNSAFIKIKNDPRVTQIGNFIRNLSIDELPQLWNVFIGDMSIVGNRPLPLYEAERITTDKYSLRFIAPAGITGLWQVEKRGRAEMSEDERLNLDNNYAKSHSFGNDIRLIMRTIPALFQSENV